MEFIISVEFLYPVWFFFPEIGILLFLYKWLLDIVYLEIF